MENDVFQIYEDIKSRTNGEIYIGVVGPVRTGKSTFIKNFMEALILPNIRDSNEKNRTIDELPQSGMGKTITTTEPKFIPKDAIEVDFAPNQSAKVRLIDCVGFMVNGVNGHLENDKERMVKTPWSDTEIPFSQAAHIGTKKVITDHSTIGLVITTDGSITEIPRENYISAEDETINELKKYNKPFIVLVNSSKPYSDDAKNVANEIMEKHGVYAMPVNCLQLKKNDINKVMEKILSVFPISQIEFSYPLWCRMLKRDDPLMTDIIGCAREILSQLSIINDASTYSYEKKDDYIDRITIDSINLKDGNIHVSFGIDNKYYYSSLSEMTGVEIENEYQLITMIKELSALKETMVNISDAFEKVQASGYSVMSMLEDDISIDKPELIKHGNKYGIKIKSTATSIHMIKAPIETEIAPIVGTMEQAQDLIDYINQTSETDEDGIWNTNIFGKSVKQLVYEGIELKINKINNETREKMQQTLCKIVNESNGGVICIIL